MNVVGPAEVTAPGRGSWLPYPMRRDDVSMRLFCFPHAGGGATAFRDWVRQRTRGVEVCPIQLPGREDRRREPPYHDLTELVEELAAALLPKLDLPFALVGNSMGAVVAFELARYLRGTRSPTRLVIAASPAPQRAPFGLPPVDRMSDEALVDFLAGRYHGIPAPILESPGLLRVFAPVLRGDLELIRAYRPPALPALSCPITAFVGAVDPMPPGYVEEWRAVTTGRFERLVIPGGHFAIFDHGERVIEMLRAAKP